MNQPFFDTAVYKQTVKDQFMVLEDYDDETLIDELKERRYAVYKGADMQEPIKKLEGLESGLISKLEKLKRGK